MTNVIKWINIKNISNKRKEK